METTIKQRLEEFADSLNISLGMLGKKSGLSNGYFRQLKRQPSIDKLEMILSTYPQLNRNWLLYGEGEMLNSAADPAPSTEENKFTTPLLPVAAWGGSLVNIDTEGVSEDDCEHIVSPVKDVDFAMPIAGDSMAPEYPSGSIVFVKKINHTAFINWGNVFLLDTTNGPLLKVVEPSDQEGYVTCISLNPSGRYKPFDVPVDTIRGMYRIVASMSLH